MCWYGDAVENVIGGILPNSGLKFAMSHTPTIYNSKFMSHIHDAFDDSPSI